MIVKVSSKVDDCKLKQGKWCEKMIPKVIPSLL